MNLDEAKNILQLCRPDHPEDLKDPVIAEALALCETHPELREWFEAQQAFDRQIAQSLSEIKPPADLQASILAGMRMHEANSTDSADSIPETSGSLSQAWWRNPWIGVAALFVIMLSFGVLPRHSSDAPLATLPASDPDADAPEVLRYLAREIDNIKMFSFDERDEDPKVLQTYLTSNGAPSPEVIPAKFEHTKSIGCVMLDYEGTKLSIICFKGDTVYHLTTADKADFPMELGAEPQIFELKDQAFKLWAEGEQVQILSVHGNKQDIPELI